MENENHLCGQRACIARLVLRIACCIKYGMAMPDSFLTQHATRKVFLDRTHIGPKQLLKPLKTGPSMPKNKPPLDVRKSLRMALFKSLLIPVLLFVFFLAAPGWLNSRIHSDLATKINSKPNLSPSEKEAELERYSSIDFEQVSLNCPP